MTDKTHFSLYVAVLFSIVSDYNFLLFIFIQSPHLIIQTESWLKYGQVMCAGWMILLFSNLQIKQFEQKFCSL